MKTDTLAYWPTLTDDSLALMRRLAGDASELAPKFGPWLYRQAIKERHRRMAAAQGDDAPLEVELLSIDAGDWSIQDLAQAGYFTQRIILCLHNTDDDALKLFMARLGLAIARRLLLQADARSSEGSMQETTLESD